MDFVKIFQVRKEEAVDAVKLGCGCLPLPEPLIEEEIIDTPNIALNILNDIDFDSCHLKNKIICEYKKILNSLECGIKVDIQLLLEEISLIEINLFVKSIFLETSTIVSEIVKAADDID